MKNPKYVPKDANWLLKKARSLVSDLGVIVRDTRVASKLVEFDTSIPENINIEEVLRRFATISPLSEYEQLVEKRMGKHDAILKARDLFNDEKYWGAHEVLESVWKNTHHEERDLLNGIILVAAAFVHDQKDEHNISIAILSRAMEKLSQAKGLYFELDLDKIKNRVLQIIETGKIERFSI
ncbi:MAG TPA: DUF309 domain-containing protein [Candidatus Nitrosopolaris sp.]|nr:DUF309 domain-containing protein [Candidatus Nitrosopolaris sp.]